MQVYESHSQEETVEIGRSIAAALEEPATILLFGELGAGKTTLTRGLALGLGVEEASVVRSPTFTLVNEYQGGSGTIYHLDLYRLEGLRDLYSIGIEEILSSHSFVIVEWGEKLLLPPDRPLNIRILAEGDGETRRIEVEMPA